MIVDEYEVFRDIARAFAKAAEGIAEAFAKVTTALASHGEQETPEQLHGPRPRRDRAQRRAPRHHRTNTSLIAHSHQPEPRGARRRGYRTGAGH